MTTDLPLAEAARFLGLSVAQTRRKVHAKELPSHRDARGRIIVELGSASSPLTPAQDPAMREVVQLRVEVGLLREAREDFFGRMEHARRHVDELTAEIRELTRQLALKDQVIAELIRRQGAG
jgi:hypothetical protein